MSGTTRRTILRRGLQAMAALGITPLAARAGTCGTQASESLRTSLNYTEPSPNAAKTCSVCSFFTAAGQCGSCTIMSDSVNPQGHCDSWAAKS